MIAKAEAKYLRISPFKIREVIELIKGQTISNAFSILEATNKKGAFLLKKALKSAASNAKNKGYSEDSLYICRIIANHGPVLKRFRAASFGRATTIRKRTAHVLIELDTPKKIIEKAKIR